MLHLCAVTYSSKVPIFFRSSFMMVKVSPLYISQNFCEITAITNLSNHCRVVKVN